MGEKHRCERETSICYLSHAPQLGTWSTTQAHALTRNQTSDLSFCRMTSNPLSFILVRVICISWRNIYLNPLPIFKLDFWVFKLLSCRSSLYTLDASLLSDTWIANIFSLILWIIFFLFFRIFIDYAITVVPFPPLHSTPSYPLPPSHIPPPILHAHGSYI